MSDDGNELPSDSNESWKELAQKASKEQDPKKLMETIGQLCDAIDAHEASLKRPQDRTCPTETKTHTASGE